MLEDFNNFWYAYRAEKRAEKIHVHQLLIIYIESLRNS